MKAKSFKFIVKYYCFNLKLNINIILLKDKHRIPLKQNRIASYLAMDIGYTYIHGYIDRE